MPQPLGPPAPLDSIIYQEEQGARIGLGQELSRPEISEERNRLARRYIQSAYDRPLSPLRGYARALDMEQKILEIVRRIKPNNACARMEIRCHPSGILHHPDGSICSHKMSKNSLRNAAQALHNAGQRHHFTTKTCFLHNIHQTQ